MQSTLTFKSQSHSHYYRLYVTRSASTPRRNLEALFHSQSSNASRFMKIWARVGLQISLWSCDKQTDQAPRIRNFLSSKNSLKIIRIIACNSSLQIKQKKYYEINFCYKKMEQPCKFNLVEVSKQQYKIIHLIQITKYWQEQKSNRIFFQRTMQ